MQIFVKSDQGVEKSILTSGENCLLGWRKQERYLVWKITGE